MRQKEIEICVMSKISQLEDVIEASGKVWQQTKSEKDLRFTCSRVVAKNRLQAYLKSL